MNATTDTYENQNSVSEKDPTHFVTACYLSTLDTAKRTYTPKRLHTKYSLY